MKEIEFAFFVLEEYYDLPQTLLTRSEEQQLLELSRELDPFEVASKVACTHEINTALA